MRQCLCDHNVPFQLTRSLPDQSVTHASELGWHELSNGQLLAATEDAGFDILITADQRIRYQQNLTGRKLALIVLDTNHWPTIRPHVARVGTAVAQVTAGGYVTVGFPRLKLNRRTFVPPEA